MTKYEISWTETIRCSTIVTAENEEEAKDKLDSEEANDNYTQGETIDTYEDIEIEKVEE